MEEEAERTGKRREEEEIEERERGGGQSRERRGEEGEGADYYSNRILALSTLVRKGAHDRWAPLSHVCVCAPPACPVPNQAREKLPVVVILLANRAYGAQTDCVPRNSKSGHQLIQNN